MKEKRFKELYDGFEDKKLIDIWSHKKFESGSVELQSNIVRRGSKGALKITIKKGDRIEKGNKNIKTSERDELLEKKEYGPHENELYNYSFSIYLPHDFPIVNTRLVLAQWKQHDEGDKAIINNPILALRYVGGKLYITLQSDEKKLRIFSTKEEIRGKWIDFSFKVNFSSSNQGIVKIKMNGKNIVNYIGRTAYPEEYGYSKPNSFYFKIGLYRDKMDKPMIIYIDEFHKKFLNHKFSPK